MTPDGYQAPKDATTSGSVPACAPMDIASALAKVPADVVLCGNLDPVAVFLQSPPADVAAKAAQLLSVTRAHRNFVISSGCDVPPASPLANLDAFYETVARH